MKKYFIRSIIYAILALVFGVFFREFTKMNNYNGITSLSYIHVHFFGLGTVMYIIVALLTNHLKLNDSKLFKASTIVYDVGLSLTCIFFLVRGIMQVKNITEKSSMVSGLAGVGHIVLAAGLIMMLVCFIILAAKNAKANKATKAQKQVKTASK